MGEASEFDSNSRLDRAYAAITVWLAGEAEFLESVDFSERWFDEEYLRSLLVKVTDLNEKLTAFCRLAKLYGNE